MAEDEDAFEAEVLRTARALFSENPLVEGSAHLDGQERDGLFVTADAVTIVEATISRRLDKAQKDGRKLVAACDQLARKYPFKSVKGYFVTRDEPTADQRTFFRTLSGPVVACSHAQLRARLIDSREYVTARANYPFGSARNPSSGDHRSLEPYIPLGFTDGGTSTVYSLEDVVEALRQGRVVALVGDYGAGKSMSLREVHRSLAKAHLGGEVSFPVTLNLRDHRGQTEPDEALERHGRRVGFEQRSRLVRAWMAGDVHLLLDGFDEIPTPGWLGRASNLRDIRRRSVELVRRAVQMRPRTVGLLITGRTHFFDSIVEMKSALGLPQDCLLLYIDDFTEVQVETYLKAHGWESAVPAWLPSRPLLLGYLAANQLLDDVVAAGVEVAAAAGWNELLNRICDREANIEVGVDGALVRGILERLATLARGRPSGVGPIWPDDLTGAFQQVTGQAPDEGSYQLLQRLPGLGTQDATEGSRFFIDVAMADAARAGDVVRFVQAPHAHAWLTEVGVATEPMDDLGVEVAITQLDAADATGSQVLSAAARCQKAGGSDALVYDLMRIAGGMKSTAQAPDLGISGITITNLALGDSEIDFARVTFDNCAIECLDLTEYSGDLPLPRFVDCLIGLVRGAGSAQVLPAGRFADCEIEQFDDSSRTTKGILGLAGLSPQQRVALTILKKIYAQRGTGRKESALHRGLDERHRPLVSDVLHALETEGLAVRVRLGRAHVLLPAKGHGVRVQRMLESGAAVSDPFLMSLR